MNFINATDTTIVNNLSDLNTYLLSNSFTLTNLSTFNFELVYGITSQDTGVVNGSKILDKNNSISYKLDLVDAESGKVIANIEKIEFDENNVPPYEEKLYKINTQSLEGSKQVRLRISAENNFNGNYALIESYSDVKSNNLAKENIKEINYKDLAVVKDYALEQNYPNPFNHTTTITYQLPNDGNVTLKVYDMLGQEIATLVNGYKTSGRYSVNFNAGNLSSGVYIYQLRVNDFSSTRKLLLLK